MDRPARRAARAAPLAAPAAAPAGPSRSRLPRLLTAALLAFPLLAAPQPLVAQASFTLDDVLSPGFAYGLVSARGADRIAWMENERGMRNVYTAAAPDFEPVQLTRHPDDDGVDLSSLQISDDGSVVLYIRGHAPNRDGWVANPSSDPRGGERAAWAASTSGGEPWRVAAVRDATLSPDGKWLLHVRDGQIHRVPVDPEAGARERWDDAPPLFRAWGRNTSPVWSPDGRRIAFVSDRESHSFIGVYDTHARTVRYLAPGVDRDRAPAWSPDGTQVAFLRSPGAPFGARIPRPDHVPREALPAGLVDAAFPSGATLAIWIADAATGEGWELWHDPPGDRRFADISRLHWGDGHLAFESEPGNWRHWFSLPVRDAPAEPAHLTPGDGFVEEATLTPDGRHLVYSTNIGDIDRRHVWRVPIGGGRAEQLTRGDGIETFPAVLASLDRVALLTAGASRPQTVGLVAATGGDVRVIASGPPERFPAAAHVTPENVVLTAPDGLEFHNQLFLPADLEPGERRPALVFIHGGPRRQMLLGYNYGHFYHMAYAVNQYFASRGYVVLSVNFRRGIGYGREFRNASGAGREGNTEYQDIRAAGVYLHDRPDVDPQRIALWGLSYGGILTAQGLARDSDLFAAGVDIAGVHLWGTELDPESVAYRSSSASEIEQWRSPVLLVHADDDRNVAFSQTVGLVQLLRAHDVPFELIVFPDDVHSFLVHARWLETFEAMDDFLERRLSAPRGVPVDAGGGR